jgi:hypothetical protein
VAATEVAFGADSGLTISRPGGAGIRAKAVVPLRARSKLCPEMFLKLVSRGWWRCGSYFQCAYTLRCRPQAAYCGAAGSGVLIPEEAAPQFLDDAAPHNGMMPPPDSEMIAPPISE